ncbi:MAG: hypothetical protein WCA45_15195 [Thiobacillaceae bacterium]
MAALGHDNQRKLILHVMGKGQVIPCRVPEGLTGFLSCVLNKLPKDALTRLQEELALFVQQANNVYPGTASKPLLTLAGF